MSLREYTDRMHSLGVLYVDVYPFSYSDSGIPQLLIMRRREDRELPGSWQPISGKILQGESIKSAFFRLVSKKSGLPVEQMFKLNSVNTFYDDYYDTVMFVPCAACRVPYRPISMDEAVHTEHRWVALEEAESLLEWPFQKACTRQVLETAASEAGFNKFQRLLIESPDNAI